MARRFGRTGRMGRRIGRTVDRVIDGDTFMLKRRAYGSRYVRISGLKAPEKG